jgi:hypothetical protein
MNHYMLCWIKDKSDISTDGQAIIGCNEKGGGLKRDGKFASLLI